MTTHDENIAPFRIDIEQGDIEELHRRLSETRWPAQLPGDDWDTGVPVTWLRDLATYWRTDYD